ncbi:MAG: hypothetical protein FuRV2_gp1 [Hangzhou rhabdovirus 2]|nr:MAG: hypothetical protein FuRV2_gp1 [Hangzhou rhabdovirus 2]
MASNSDNTATHMFFNTEYKEERYEDPITYFVLISKEFPTLFDLEKFIEYEIRANFIGSNPVTLSTIMTYLYKLTVDRIYSAGDGHNLSKISKKCQVSNPSYPMYILSTDLTNPGFRTELGRGVAKLLLRPVMTLYVIVLGTLNFGESILTLEKLSRKEVDEESCQPPRKKQKMESMNCL